ncbi:hypothetical protein JW964_03890 [candidate division KSB1 bacterium]|nr:hypothetical protein [candidate division KSB1 bacterium]
MTIPQLRAQSHLSNPQLWTQFTVSNGLPEGGIRHVLEDADGTLLVVTINNGIYRYDGLQFQSLSLNASLPTLFIQQVVRDKNNRLWIACNYAGIWIYDQGQLSPFKFNDLFERQHFAALICDQDGYLWIDVNQVGLFRTDGISCENFTLKYNLPREDIIQICQDIDSDYYFLYRHAGLFQFDFLDRKELKKIISNEPQILSFCITRNRDIWLARKHRGITRYKNKRETLILNERIVNDPFVDFFLEDSNENIWFCHQNKIYGYHHGQLDVHSPGEFEFGKPFQDRFHNIWFATPNILFKFINSQIKKWPFAISALNSNKNQLNKATNRFFIQDNEGKYWFTDDADQLYYFDGNQIHSFQLPDSLKNIKITNFAQDSAGNYWIGTHGHGVFYDDGEKISQPIPQDSLPGDFISTLYLDSKQRLWIGSLTALPQFSSPKAPDIANTIPVYSNQHFDDIGITSFYVDEQETVWFGTSDSRLIHSSNQQFVFNKPNKISQPFYQNIQNLFRDKDNIRGTSQKGIFRYHIMHEDFEFFANPALVPEIHRPPLASNFQWIKGDFCHQNSIYLLEPYKNYPQNPAMTIYDISSVCEDDKKGVWIGSYSVGLFYLNPDTLIRFNQNSGLTSFKIGSLYFDQNKTLWVGTLDQGLFQYQDKKFIQPSELKKIGKSIYCFLEDQPGDLWVGTLDNGLAFLHNEKSTIFQKNLPHFSIWGIGKSPEGHIYVCLKDARFGKLQGDRFILFPREAILYDHDLRKAFKAKTINFQKHFLNANGIISSGLICYDGEKIRKFNVGNGLPGHEIIDIEETADGRLWIATFNTGLAVLENDHFRTLTSSKISGISRIIALCAAKDSALWVVSQDEGIAFIQHDSVKSWGVDSKVITINPRDIQVSTHNQAILSSANNFYFFNFGKISQIPGMPSFDAAEEIGPYFICDSLNQIWFTTKNRELYCYKLPQEAPIIRITACQIGNKVFDDTQFSTPIEVEYFENAGAIEFSGYHSSFPSRQMMYSYQINQNNRVYESGKIEDQTRLIFTRLEPGQTHLFEFRAKTPDGQVSPIPATIRIRLAPKPLFLQSWFHLLMVLIFAFGVTFYFIYRYYKINQLIFRRRFNPYIAGDPIFRSDLFFGRDEIVKKILSIIHNNSIMITGERRIGKTSLLIQLKNILLETNDPEFQFMPIFIDLQGIGQWEFFHAIIHDILEQTRIDLSTIELKYEDKTDNYSYRDFNADFRKVIQYFTLQTSKTVKLVLLIDEADAMNQYDQSIHARLRRIFMQEFSSNFAAILSGTNYIQNWNRPESPWWNLFTLIELNAFHPSDAKKLILAPVKGIFKFQSDAIDTILEVTGGKPYPIQKLCINLVNRALDRYRRTIRREDVLVIIDQEPTFTGKINSI